MTALLAYSATPVSELTEAQLAELSTALLRELRRLAPGTTRTANRQDVRAQVRMRLIRNALKRIRAGSYGACLTCQSLIPYERLAVIPDTQICVRCASG
ncbi:MAG TPA: TraR/DksA C4-type zinc finger protein [Chloroflexota bacterium]|jgi:DnaK suppressor protein|nr:TraR/DksA C4-type zinc finger protein [Chloroflexota bacterium]